MKGCNMEALAQQIKSQFSAEIKTVQMDCCAEVAE
jgi:hypothetical protein